MSRSANAISVYVEDGEIVIDTSSELDPHARISVTGDQINQLVEWLREKQVELQGIKRDG